MSDGQDIDAADWVDDDLLTRDEAGDRLVMAIEVARARLRELEAPGRERSEATASVRMVTRRLAAMENLRDSL